MKSEEEIERLRGLRQSKAEAMRNGRLRDVHGDVLVAAINDSTGLAFRLEDFVESSLDQLLVWPEDIRDAPGLVCAYVERPVVATIISRVAGKLGPVAGYVGFHDKPYLGFAEVAAFDPGWLLDIAIAATDSAMFVSADRGLVIMVDRYGNDPKYEFSVVVQADANTLRALEGCIDAGK